MSPSLMTVVLAAVLSQAGPEAGWLKAVPTEADVVVRVRGVEPLRDDLVAMVRAMSPALADQVEPMLSQLTDQFSQQVGKPAAQTPFLAIFRAEPPSRPGGAPPFAVIVKSDNYQGVLDAVAGGKAQTKQDPGGLDSFLGRQGETMFATKGQGWVGFGPDSKLVTGLSKPAGKTLGDSLPAELTDRFLAGDVGIYVNVSSLQSRYARQIDDARAQLMTTFDQLGQQAGNAGVMDAAKGIYAGLFDSLQVADGLVLGLDFAKDGLKLDGETTLKSDSKAAASLSSEANGDPSGLAKLPADGSYFVYLNINPDFVNRLQHMGLAMMATGGKPSPEMEKAVALQKEAGRTESIGTSRIDHGMQTLNVMSAQDPKKLKEASLAMMQAMKDQKGGAAGIFKDITVTPDAQGYKDISFTAAKMTLDFDAVAKAQPNPGTAEMLKGMFGGNSTTTWIGQDGPKVISVAAPDWDRARALLDTYYSGQNTIGSAAAYNTVRSGLPEKASVMALISAQGIVRQLAGQFSAMLQNPDLKAPADMPKEPALLGVSLASSSKGYQFRLVVPSSVGPVFEKGMLPLVRTLQGKVNQ